LWFSGETPATMIAAQTRFRQELIGGKQYMHCVTVTTWQDKTYALNRFGEMTEYQHPWFQTFTMFTGELLCLVAFSVCFGVVCFVIC
jgi:hypothetical protein